MNTNFQIQSLKSQIMNMKSQIDNIESQNNNLLIMNNNKIGDQLLNLSLQMLNTGIQAYTLGKNIANNYFNYFEQLKLISQQINSLINENIKMQQQMMMQQNIMMQQQQMMMKQQNQNIMMKPEVYNIVFKNLNKNITIVINIQEGSTIEELLNKFIDKAKNTFNDEQIKKMKFYSANSNILNLNRKDKRNIDINFRNATIFVEY